MDFDRPILASIDQHIDQQSVTVVVTLESNGQTYEGEMTGDTKPAHRARLVGEATLRAVELMTSNPAKLDLMAVATSDIGGFEVALVQIKEGGNDLIGSALILHGDPASATARAVLDALNRRLAKIR
jgi:hypothetical protein